MIENKCVPDSTAAICPCQSQGGAIVRQPSAAYRLWGGLSISHREMLKTSHQPGCCWYKRSTKTTITYNGLRFLLSKVVALSVQRDYKAGICLTTYLPRTYNIREKSPWADVFSQGGRGTLTNLAEKHMKQLQSIYSSGEISPLDVDRHGYNAAHVFISVSSLINRATYSNLTRPAVLRGSAQL